MGWTLEDNESINSLIEEAGAKRYKKYRYIQKVLMKSKATERIYRAYLLVVMICTGGGCGRMCPPPRLYAPMQPDGWSAQPIAIECRFTPDADLDPATGTPVGDEGYYLYILNEAANWDYSTATSLLFSIWHASVGA